jgi:hypothetical protein
MSQKRNFHEEGNAALRIAARFLAETADDRRLPVPQNDAGTRPLGDDGGIAVHRIAEIQFVLVGQDAKLQGPVADHVGRHLQPQHRLLELHVHFPFAHGLERNLAPAFDAGRLIVQRGDGRTGKNPELSRLFQRGKPKPEHVGAQFFSDEPDIEAGSVPNLRYDARQALDGSRRGLNPSGAFIRADGPAGESADSGADPKIPISASGAIVPAPLDAQFPGGIRGRLHDAGLDPDLERAPIQIPEQDLDPIHIAPVRVDDEGVGERVHHDAAPSSFRPLLQHGTEDFAQIRRIPVLDGENPRLQRRDVFDFAPFRLSALLEFQKLKILGQIFRGHHPQDVSFPGIGQSVGAKQAQKDVAPGLVHDVQTGPSPDIIAEDEVLPGDPRQRTKKEAHFHIAHIQIDTPIGKRSFRGRFERRPPFSGFRHRGAFRRFRDFEVGGPRLRERRNRKRIRFGRGRIRGWRFRNGGNARRLRNDGRKFRSRRMFRRATRPGQEKDQAEDPAEGSRKPALRDRGIQGDALRSKSNRGMGMSRRSSPPITMRWGAISLIT